MDITNTQNNQINTETAVADLGTEQVASLAPVAKQEAAGFSGKQINTDAFVSVAPTATPKAPVSRPMAGSQFQAKLSAEKSIGSACELAYEMLTHNHGTENEVRLVGTAFFNPVTGKAVAVKWDAATGLGSDADGLSEELAHTAERLILSRSRMQDFPHSAEFNLGDDTAQLIPVPFHVSIN